SGWISSRRKASSTTTTCPRQRLRHGAAPCRRSCRRRSRRRKRSRPPFRPCSRTARSTSMRSRRRSWAPVAFLLPALLIYTLLHTAPFLGTLALSTFSYDGLRPAEFVGAGNYSVMLQDDVFWHSLRNNAIWFFGEVVVATLVGLGLALLINSRQRLSALFRTTLFIP